MAVVYLIKLVYNSEHWFIFHGNVSMMASSPKVGTKSNDKMRQKVVVRCAVVRLIAAVELFQLYHSHFIQLCVYLLRVGQLHGK